MACVSSNALLHARSSSEKEEIPRNESNGWVHLLERSYLVVKNDQQGMTKPGLETV